MTIKDFLFSKKYNSLPYRVNYFFKYKIPFSNGWNEYHNPLYIWWKVRKYFKRPKAHFHFGKPEWFFGFPIREDYINPVIDIRFSSLGWKSKYNSPRHEWDPYISITFFRKYRLLWLFNFITENNSEESTRSMATWEAILDYLYFDKSLEWVRNNHVWLNNDKSEITINKNLK